MSIAVGMSGGVDSTLTAAVLRDEGHEVVGLTMRIWDGRQPVPAGGRSGCYGPDEPAEIARAQALAGQLGIAHHVVSLTAEYNDAVLAYFRREYLAGRTPNPCVRCNQAIKFGALLSAARRAGIAFDAFATGHYARVARDPATGRHILRRATDPAKDQSYFLSRLTQAQLAIARFPLGTWDKRRVRARARALGLDAVADEPESQDFVGGAYAALFERASVSPGPLLDRGGKVLGVHKGIVHYTIGQRKGLELGGLAEPCYVVAIDAARNAVIVGPRSELLAPGLVATDVNWIAVDGLNGPCEADVRIRDPANGGHARTSRCVLPGRYRFGRRMDRAGDRRYRRKTGLKTPAESGRVVSGRNVCPMV